MVAILDQWGDPLQRDALNEPQTAQVASLHQEFAAHPVRGLTPFKLASILEEAERGDIQAQCDLFEDMEEKDGHILAEMGKRKRALIGVDWDILPPRNATPQEEKAAEYVKELIQDIPNFEDVLLDMGDAIGHGFSCLEYDWQRLGKEWLPRSISHRPPRWFMTDRDTRTELRLRDNSADGQALQAFGWVTHIHKAKSGYLSRAGLHRALAWPFLFKNYSVRDLAEFLEIYGLPLRLGTYPTGATNKEKSTLMKAVVNIGHAAAGIIPEGMAIEFTEAAKGSKDPYEAMINWCERTQSKAILGGTLTSQADGKSSTNALGNVHNEVRHDLLDADARQIGSTLTRDLVYPLLALNTSGVDNLRRCPRWHFHTEEGEDLDARAERDTKVFAMGYEPSEEYIQQTYGDGWTKKARTNNAPGTEALKAHGSQQSCQHCATAALKHNDAHKDVADDFTEQLDEAATAAMDGLIEPVRDLVMKADSLEALRDGLIELSEKQDIDDLVGTMQQAFAAAELSGRFEVNEGE